MSRPAASKATDAVYLSDILAPDRNSFGAIRLAMAVAVLFSHSYLFRFGAVGSEPLESWTGHSLGEHAVQVFFFLSGILIAQSFDRSRNLVAFAAARALRIFPGLIVCVLATALLLGPVVSRLDGVAYFTDARLAAYILKTAGLVTGSAPLPGVFTDLPTAPLVNMSLWTLKYEVVCYFAVALLGVAGLFEPKWRSYAVGSLALLVAFAFVGEPKPAETFTTFDNVRYFTVYFGTGTLAYLLRDRIVIHPLLALPLLGVFLNAIGTRFAEVSAALFLGYATLVAASLSFGPLSRATREHDYSFGVYIYAAPTQQTLLQWMPEIDPLALSFWSLAAVVPLAYLSWTYIERPALTLRRRFDGLSALRSLLPDVGRLPLADRPVPQPSRPAIPLPTWRRPAISLPLASKHEAPRRLLA